METKLRLITGEDKKGKFGRILEISKFTFPAYDRWSTLQNPNQEGHAVA